MSTFCTYFDSGYLARGLALYHSLRANCAGATLWALCFDQAAYDALARASLPGLRPIALADFERGDEALLAAKAGRTRVEYYFTCTPSLPLYIFRLEPDIDLITYLDADLYFFGDPAPLFAELAGHSIAITPHRFPPHLRRLEATGIYNVAWLSFRSDANGLQALNWWRERCLEWCFDRLEPTRFADQKYLDDWPTRFRGVVVLNHKGANLAPWNFSQYHLRRDQGRLWVDDQPLIFFHFHGLKQVLPWLYDANVSNYHAALSGFARHYIYRPYLGALNLASHSQPIAITQAPARTSDLHANPVLRPSLSERVRQLAIRAAHPLRALWARQYLLALGDRIY